MKSYPPSVQACSLFPPPSFRFPICDWTARTHCVNEWTPFFFPGAFPKKDRHEFAVLENVSSSPSSPLHVVDLDSWTQIATRGAKPDKDSPPGVVYRQARVESFFFYKIFSSFLYLDRTVRVYSFFSATEFGRAVLFFSWVCRFSSTFQRLFQPPFSPSWRELGPLGFFFFSLPPLPPRPFMDLRLPRQENSKMAEFVFLPLRLASKAVFFFCLRCDRRRLTLFSSFLSRAAGSNFPFSFLRVGDSHFCPRNGFLGCVLRAKHLRFFFFSFLLCRCRFFLRSATNPLPPPLRRSSRPSFFFPLWRQRR